MPRKHYNPKTKKLATCRAKTQEACPLKDEAGNSAPHFENEGDARIGYERIMAEQNDPHSSLSKLSPMEQALSVLPEQHRNFYESSDAFYNTSNTMDLEALEKLAVFNYIKMSERGNLPVHGKRFHESKLREEIVATEFGKDWHGRNDYMFVDKEAREPYLAENPVPLKLSEVKTESQYDKRLLHYAQDSLEYMKKLNPSEHNAMAYWSSAGSAVMGSLVYTPEKCMQGLQGDDPEDDGYYEPEPFLKKMDQALQKAELDEPKQLYRGLNEEIVPRAVRREIRERRYLKEGQTASDKETNDWLQSNYPVGSEIEFKTPCSTTSEEKVANGFSNGVVLRVKAHRAGALGVVSAWGFREAEYVIPRDVKYKVVGTSYSGNNKELIIELEQL